MQKKTLILFGIPLLMGFLLIAWRVQASASPTGTQFDQWPAVTLVRTSSDWSVTEGFVTPPISPDWMIGDYDIKHWEWFPAPFSDERAIGYTYKSTHKSKTTYNTRPGSTCTLDETYQADSTGSYAGSGVSKRVCVNGTSSSDVIKYDPTGGPPSESVGKLSATISNIKKTLQGDNRTALLITNNANPAYCYRIPISVVVVEQKISDDGSLYDSGTIPCASIKVAGNTPDKNCEVGIFTWGNKNSRIDVTPSANVPMYTYQVSNMVSGVTQIADRKYCNNAQPTPINPAEQSMVNSSGVQQEGNPSLLQQVTSFVAGAVSNAVNFVTGGSGNSSAQPQARQPVLRPTQDVPYVFLQLVKSNNIENESFVTPPKNPDWMIRDSYMSVWDWFAEPFSDPSAGGFALSAFTSNKVTYNTRPGNSCTVTKRYNADGQGSGTGSYQEETECEDGTRESRTDNLDLTDAKQSRQNGHFEYVDGANIKHSLTSYSETDLITANDANPNTCYAFPVYVSVSKLGLDENGDFRELGVEPCTSVLGVSGGIIGLQGSEKSDNPNVCVFDVYVSGKKGSRVDVTPVVTGSDMIDYSVSLGGPVVPKTVNAAFCEETAEEPLPSVGKTVDTNDSINSNPSLLQQVTSFVTGLFGGGSTQPAATQSNQQQTQKVTQTNSFMFRPVNVSQADRDAMAQRLNQKKVNATKTDRENMAKRLQHLNINGQ